MKKLLTLCFIHQGDNVLLGMKKRGKGVDKWNGFGGKVEVGESIEDAASREVLEEVGLRVPSLEKIGIIDFTLPKEQEIWQVHIFRATDFTGTPTETEEMRPQWFAIEDIPYDLMWKDDPYWFPLLFAGKKFTGTFVFNAEEDTILDHAITEVENLPS